MILLMFLSQIEASFFVSNEKVDEHFEAKKATLLMRFMLLNSNRAVPGCHQPSAFEPVFSFWTNRVISRLKLYRWVIVLVLELILKREIELLSIKVLLPYEKKKKKKLIWLFLFDWSAYIPYLTSWTTHIAFVNSIISNYVWTVKCVCVCIGTLHENVFNSICFKHQTKFSFKHYPYWWHPSPSFFNTINLVN